MLRLERIKDLLAAARGKRILVVGDLMLDRYVRGRVSRISPEAPVPVVHVTEERCLPGGAANVALNIQDLGGQAVLAGTVGEDAIGSTLREVLASRGIRVDGIVADPRLQTCEKTRVMAEHQQVVRVDREDSPAVQRVAQPALAARIRDVAVTVDGIIIEDYGKGVVSQETVDAVLAVALPARIPVGLDPKDNHALAFEALTLATPNYKEACDAAGFALQNLDDPSTQGQLREIGGVLERKWHTEFLAVTLGAHGMYLQGRGESPVRIPTRAREVFDVCGAGDTVIATAMLMCVAGASHEEAVLLANYAAGIVVGKLGAATCTPGELIAYLEQELR